MIVEFLVSLVDLALVGGFAPWLNAKEAEGYSYLDRQPVWGGMGGVVGGWSVLFRKK